MEIFQSFGVPSKQLTHSCNALLCIMANTKVQGIQYTNNILIQMYGRSVVFIIRDHDSHIVAIGTIQSIGMPHTNLRRKVDC